MTVADTIYLTIPQSKIKQIDDLNETVDPSLLFKDCSNYKF